MMIEFGFVEMVQKRFVWSRRYIDFMVAKSNRRREHDWYALHSSAVSFCVRLGQSNVLIFWREKKVRLKCISIPLDFLPFVVWRVSRWFRERNIWCLSSRAKSANYPHAFHIHERRIWYHSIGQYRLWWSATWTRELQLITDDVFSCGSTRNGMQVHSS